MTAILPEHSVQVIPHRNTDLGGDRREGLAIFVVFAAAYVGLGWWLVADLHLVGFDTLDRFDRALMVWHNDPAKLSALGYDLPPLSTLLITPLTLVPSWTRSLLVVPFASALFAAWLMVSLHTVMRRAGIARGMRYVLLILLGLNPLYALYAADGARDLLGLSLVVAAAGALLSWYLTADVRFMMLSGLAIALGAIADYNALVWILLGAGLLVGVLGRHGAGEAEVEGTLVGFLAPPVFALVLWSALCALLTHNPFSWIHHSSGPHPSVGTLVTQTGQLVAAGAPIAVPVLLGLLVVGAARRDRFALWWAAALVVTIVSPAVAAGLGLSQAPMALRAALPIMLVAVLAGLWMVRSVTDRAFAVAAVLAVLLAVSIPWTFVAMRHYPRQGLESGFVAALEHGKSQEGTTSRGGAQIGYDDELTMADWIRTHVSTDGAVLTDNSHTYAVMLLSGHPQLFDDRVDHSDGPWETVAHAPAGRVSYMLLTRGTSDDQLSALYPKAADGSDAAYPVVLQNDRYTLVQVPPVPGALSAGDNS
jgi:hypothetical protein